MPEFLHLQKLGKKLQSTAWSSQILQHLEQFLKNWFLHSKLSNSTSTPALLFYKSTTFLSLNSTFYNFFFWKFYIYKHPKFLQFYNIFSTIFYILQWFFRPNLQSTFTPPSPLSRIWKNLGKIILTIFLILLKSSLKNYILNCDLSSLTKYFSMSV